MAKEFKARSHPGSEELTLMVIGCGEIGDSFSFSDGAS